MQSGESAWEQREKGSIPWCASCSYRSPEATAFTRSGGHSLTPRGQGLTPIQSQSWQGHISAVTFAQIKLEFDAEAVRQFCQERGIARLELFGSALRDDFDSDSDVD